MALSVEFDHSIGLSLVPGGLCFHPDGEDYLFCAGGNVIVAKLTDPHEQHFLRRHDDYITTLALSPLGNLIASGQRGHNSNVYVWNFATKDVIFSLEEHDSSIKDVAFSHDERILATLGDSEDKKMIFWDLSNGYIIAAKNVMPNGSCCVSFGGFQKDVKRRDTTNYLVCTGGAEGLVLWYLDPYSGQLEMDALTSDAHGSLSRSITTISFYKDNEFVCAGSTSGDFIIVSVRAKRVVKVVQVGKLCVNAILSYEYGIIVGGGEGAIKCYDNEQLLQGQVYLDGAVIALSFSPDKLEVRIFCLPG